MVSVVIPVRDEEATVGPLCRGIEQVLAEPREIIFVDDGSTDRTWEELAKLHRPGRVRAIRLARNFGKTPALAAGFAASRGEVIFTMDGDLQDDPQEIPRFLARLEEGYDLVSGWKKIRHDPAGKVLASRLFNFVVGRLTGLRLHDINCGFKAYRAAVARSLPLFAEMHRFTPVLAHAMGYRVTELVVTHHPRRHGRSHYGFARLGKGFLDLFTVLLLTRWSQRPSHGFALAAVVALVPGALLLFSPRPPWPLLGAVLLAGAVVFLAAGLLAEILVNRSSSGAPRCRIREQLD